MHRFTSRIRQPVQREGAEQYLLITLLSFAASVTLTRLFLEIAGYPKLGGGEIHIAHVLWGGLLLFVAALLPLLIANRWVYMSGALLAGAGVGLFIDEVGKFITQNNNYFYPLAAPIVYAFFLLTVLLYLRVRRPRPRGPRSEFYRALDSLEEVLEHDLDRVEREQLRERLRYVAEQDEDPDLKRLATSLLEYLSSDTLSLVPRRPKPWDRYIEAGQKFAQRWVTRRRLQAILAGGLFALGLVAIVNMIRALPIGPEPTSLEQILVRLINEGQVRSISGLNWFAARLALETTIGLMLLVSCALFLAGKDRPAVAVSYLGLLLSLTTVDLLLFYFDQFSTIITAFVQFSLLMGVIYYQRTYLSPTLFERQPQSNSLAALSTQESEADGS
jgi:hypothetical protein